MMMIIIMMIIIMMIIIMMMTMITMIDDDDYDLYHKKTSNFLLFPTQTMSNLLGTPAPPPLPWG